MNKLVGLYCSLLGCPLVLLCGIHFFIAIADISFNIIIEGNVVIGEMFF